MEPKKLDMHSTSEIHHGLKAVCDDSIWGTYFVNTLDPLSLPDGFVEWAAASNVFVLGICCGLTCVDKPH
ncbi:hypothetical protein K1719_023038 [Acacia pycnantha]|nr:hypothetical protein K1719_023038 [Acacia pycnantha]